MYDSTVFNVTIPAICRKKSTNCNTGDWNANDVLKLRRDIDTPYTNLIEDQKRRFISSAIKKRTQLREMLKFCLMILCLGYAGAILPPAILEMIDHFFLGFPPKTPRQKTLDYTLPFDFVVIGAGSAGSALVNRLTENPDWNVLVLEQGNDENFLTDIPLFAPVLHITDYGRVYRSEPRPQDANGDGGYCLSMIEGRCNVVSGRAVGGTSVVNFMIYSRGAPADYDASWALDNPGWSYKDVLPYFIKSERCKLIDKDARYVFKSELIHLFHSLVLVEALVTFCITI